MTDLTVAEPDASVPLSALAAHHGLRVAGQRPGIVTYARTLWQYRHFIASYANAKAVSALGTTRLGRLWQVLTPLSNAAVYYLIFGVLFGGRDDIPNFIGYLCVGLFVFVFTQTAVTTGLQSISGNLGLVRALHFPRASLPIAATATQVQNMAVSIVVLMGIVLATGESVTVRWFFLLPALLLQSIFNVGLALFVARLGSRLVDLRQVAPFVLRTWMYGSAVLFSPVLFAAKLPPAAAAVVEANPLLVYIELFRSALLENAPLASSPLQLWLMGVGWAAFIAIAGFVYFWRGEQEYGRG